MPSRGGRARTSLTQIEIEWTLDKKHEWGFGKQSQSSGSQNLRSGGLGDGYRDNSEVTLSDRAVHR